MSDRDYVLGTHDAEIERLGLQHRVWRPRALAAWQRAGIAAGQTVIDLGAGPGYAALDLAEIVGSRGRVIAVERSRRFLDALESMARGRGLANITTVAADAVDAPFGEAVADASWCRWVLSFVREPKAVVAHLARALKPGGVAVFQEYLDYSSWRLAPQSAPPPATSPTGTSNRGRSPFSRGGRSWSTWRGPSRLARLSAPARPER